jgi:tetratricopeptide (TPR) repeat protein
MDVLFQRPDLQVRSARSFGSDVCFVTFDSYSDLGTLDRPGFAEGFLASRGIDAVHILSRSNDWYLYPYSAEAFETARAAVAGYGHVFTYGSSMGGYAAIRFGRRVGARTAIAMSPQFSINPATPPFEQRWFYDSEVIDFSLEAAFEGDFVERAYIFYDPRNEDRLHVDCFRGRTAVLDVPIVNGGHPVTTMLSEVGLLTGAILGIVDGSFDRAAFFRELRANRRRSAQLFYNIAGNMRRPETAIHFARIAAELRPDHVRFAAYLGALLLRARRFDEARATLDQAMAADGRDQGVRYRVSEFHEATGDLDTAIAIMDDLVREFPMSRSHALRRDFLIDEMVETTFKAMIRAGRDIGIVVA